MKERIPKLDVDNPLGLFFSLAVCPREKVAPTRELDLLTFHSLLPTLFASNGPETCRNRRSIKLRPTEEEGRYNVSLECTFELWLPEEFLFPFFFSSPPLTSATLESWRKRPKIRNRERHTGSLCSVFNFNEIDYYERSSNGPVTRCNIDKFFSTFFFPRSTEETGCISFHSKLPFFYFFFFFF